MNLRITAAALVACLVAPLACAQLEPIDAPITLTIAPAVAMPGAAVVLSGATPFVTGKPGAVALSISPPASNGGDGDGTPVMVEAPVDQEGRYTISFKATAAMGEYRVTGTAPDGKGTAQGKFAVLQLSSEKVAEQVTGTVYKGYQQLLDSTDQALSASSEIISSLPDSPEKAEATSKLAQVTAHMADRRKATAQAVIQLGQFTKVATDAGAGAALKAPLAAVLESVAEMQAEARDKEAQIQQRVAASKAAVDQCVKIDTAVELLNLASMLINVYDKPLKIIINLFTDKAIPAGIDASKGSENQKFVVTESQKGLAAFGMGGGKGVTKFAESSIGIGSVSFPTGILIDITNFALKKLYDKLCTRFEGPFDATLKGTFKNEGRPFWNYTMALRGKLVLSAPKGATDTQMKGRFEGVVTRYEVEQNIVKAMAPKLQSFVVFSQLSVPQVVTSLVAFDESGSYFNQLLPTSFYVPASGVRTGSKIVVNADEKGQVGLLPKTNRAQYFVVIMSGMIPELVVQTLPFEGAGFLIARGMRKDATFEITGSKGEEVITRQFTRDETLDNGDINIKFAVNVKACNPKCTKSTIQNGADRLKKFTDQFKSSGQK